MTREFKRSHDSGQTQILAAMAMAVVMLSAALYSLQYAQQTQKYELSTSRMTELRTVLDEAIKRASYLYHSESGCDPISLDNKLARMNPDGTLTSATAPLLGHRYLQLTVNSNTYMVSYSAVTRIPWLGNIAGLTDQSIQANGPTLGISQDAVVQVWTTYGYGSATQRVSETAALINNCTYPCSAASPGYPSDQCEVASDAAISYHQIIDPTTFAGAPLSPLGPATCPGVADRYLGNVKVPAGTKCPAPAVASNSINIDDVITLKNYLRSGDWAGSCTGVLIACADLNNDGLVDEMDLNVLEKVLRGYLYWIPVHY